MSSQKSAEASRCLADVFSEHSGSRRWQLGREVKKYETRNKNSSQKAVFSRQFSQENSPWSFFAQPEGHMNTEEMLRVIRRNTLEAIFQVMRVVVNYRKGQKQFLQFPQLNNFNIFLNVLHSESTLATAPIYNQAYPEKPSTASPGNSVRVTKPSSLLLCNRIQSLRKSRQKWRTTFGNKSRTKIRWQSKVASELTAKRIV